MLDLASSDVALALQRNPALLSQPGVAIALQLVDEAQRLDPDAAYAYVNAALTDARGYGTLILSRARDAAYRLTDSGIADALAFADACDREASITEMFPDGRPAMAARDARYQAQLSRAQAAASMAARQALAA